MEKLDNKVLLDSLHNSFSKDNGLCKQKNNNKNILNFSNIYQNKDSLLPFLKLYIGNDISKTFTIHGLLDSGSVRCFINQTAFMSISDYENVKEVPLNQKVYSASNTPIDILSKCIINFYLKDDQSKYHKFSWEFYITKQLVHDIYIGYDFILQNIIKHISTDHIMFCNEKSKKNEYRVKIENMHSSFNNNNNNILLTIENISFPPKSSIIILTESIDKSNNMQKISVNDSSTQLDNLEILPTISQNVGNYFPIIVHNNSNETICTPNNFHIADFTLVENLENYIKYDLSNNAIVYTNSLSDDVTVCENHFYENNETDFQINGILDKNEIYNSLNLDAEERKMIDFFQEHVALTKEEIQEIIERYRTDGATAIPATVLGNTLQKYTEFKLDDSNDTEKSKTDDEIMSCIDISHLSKKQKFQVYDLIKRHMPVFSRHTYDVGKTSLVTANIILKKDALKNCSQCKFYPVPPKLKDRVSKLLDTLEKNDIITKCSQFTPIISNLLIRPKKNSNELRVCLDGRLIGELSHKYPTVMTNTCEIIEHFKNFTFATSLDLSQAFYSIMLDPKVVPLTSFYAPNKKKFAFKRLVQGHHSSSAIFENLMSIILDGMPESLCFVDDLFLSTQGSFEHHLQKLSELLDRIHKGGLKIKPNKLKICLKSIQVLGYQVNLGGNFSIPSARCDALTNYKTPGSCKEIKSFIASCSFYRKLIPRFSELAYDLMELTHKHHKSFKMTEAGLESFKNLKKAISNAITITSPDHSLPYYAFSDSSIKSLSFILYQLPESGQIKHIGATSRILTKSEQSNSIFKLEVLAILCGLKIFDYLLAYAECTIYSDARSIIFLRACKTSSPQLTRFALIISSYQLKIIHVSASLNGLADDFSRSMIQYKNHEDYTPMNQKEAHNLCSKLLMPENTVIEPETLKKLLDLPGIPSSKQKALAKTKSTNVSITPSTYKAETIPKKKSKLPKVIKSSISYRHKNHFDKIREEQAPYDSTINSIHFNENNLDYNDLYLNSKLINDGKISLESFKECQQTDEFCEDIKAKDPLPKDYLIRKNLLIKKINGHEKLVLPEKLLNSMLVNMHYTVLGQHKSASAMQKTISEHYFFPDLTRICKKYYENCYLCLIDKAKNVKSNTFGKIQIADASRKQYSFDLASGLYSINGFSYVIIWVDTFSLYCILRPIKNKSTAEILQSFKFDLLARFGCPFEILSDGESALNSNEFRDYCNSLDIKLNLTAPHCAFSNSISELMIKRLKTSLRLYSHQTGQNWLTYLPVINYSLNANINKYGFSSEEILFGNKIAKNDLLSFSTQTTNFDDYVKKLTDHISNIAATYSQKREKAKDESRKYANSNKESKIFHEQQLVVYKNSKLTEICGKGMKHKYIGPYIIIKINPDNYTAIIQNIHNNSQVKAHFSHLMPIKGNFESTHTPIKNEAIKYIAQSKKHEYDLR